MLDKLAKGESEVESAEQLFTKIRNDFGETSEEKRKIEQLRIIEQGGRTCDEYVQEFKKVARGSGYEGRPLIKEFKQGLNGAIRRKLAEAEEPPTTIGVARKGSETGQKPETKQGRRESTGEKCSVPRGKCTAKRRRII